MLIDKPIETERLILKNFGVEAASGNYYYWLRDPLVNEFLEVRHHIPNQSELEQYIARINSSDDNLLLGIFLKDNVHIGNIKIGPINWLYERGMIGILIGQRDEWGKGYATEAIGGLTHYAFEHLHLSAVWAGCYSTNWASFKAFLNVGYKESGRQSSYWKINSKFVDNILLVKFKNDDRTYS